MNTPGVNVVRRRKESETVVGGDVLLATELWIVTALITLKRRVVEKNFTVFVANPGTASEFAVLEEPIPEVFRKEVETYVASLGGLRSTITEIDEIDEWAAVTVLIDNGLSGNQREITAQNFIVFKDSGSMAHAKDMR